MLLFTNTQICKYAHKTRYHECLYQIKAVFPSKDLDVIVEGCNSHDHTYPDDYVESNQGFVARVHQEQK